MLLRHKCGDGLGENHNESNKSKYADGMLCDKADH
jgi:hypothetical protein